MKKTFGKKSNNSGIVYVPYIIDITTPTIIDNFNPKMNIKSRYSLNSINSKFYGDIWTTNMKRKSKIEKIYKIEEPTEF